MTCSIVMSVYYKEDPLYLKECFESIENQTILPSELILVKDGSLTSSLENVIANFQNRIPIKLVKLEENMGLGAALNAGILASSHDLIVRMDTDDRMKPNRIEVLLDFMDKNPSIGVCGSAAVVIDENGVETGVRKNPLEHEQILSNLWANPLIHPSIIVRKKAIEAVKLYDSKLKRRQDYELWFRLAKNGVKFANLSETLLDYRFSNQTLKKQSVKLAFEQAMIGYRGCKLLETKYIYRLFCFYPFFRSLLPVRLQALVVNSLKIIDPRAKE